ncbi:MAG: hypothetical protein ACO4CS_16075 [bacterium]
MDWRQSLPLVKELAGDGSVVAYRRAFAKVAGGAIAGLFLSQVYYHACRTNDPDGWFCRTGEEWSEELCFTRAELTKARKALKDRGILEEVKRGIPSRIHYRLNLEVFLTALNGLQTGFTPHEILTAYQGRIHAFGRAAFARAKKQGAEAVEVDYVELLKSRGFVCAKCGEAITAPPVFGRSDRLSFDYQVPLEEGGSHQEKNIIAVHADCQQTVVQEINNPVCWNEASQFVENQQTVVQEISKLSIYREFKKNKREEEEELPKGKVEEVVDNGLVVPIQLEAKQGKDSSVKGSKPLMPGQRSSVAKRFKSNQETVKAILGELTKDVEGFLDWRCNYLSRTPYYSEQHPEIKVTHGVVLKGYSRGLEKAFTDEEKEIALVNLRETLEADVSSWPKPQLQAQEDGKKAALDELATLYKKDPTAAYRLGTEWGLWNEFVKKKA